jgi:hypothetical protein
LRRWMVLFLAKACTGEEKLQPVIPVGWCYIWVHVSHFYWEQQKQYLEYCR